MSASSNVSIILFTPVKWGIFTCWWSPKSQANLAEFNPTPLLTQPHSSCRSTSGHMPWFWLTSDGHYSFYDGNNNFHAVLMIVIIMLETHSPNSVLIAAWQPQRGVSELTSKVWFTSQWSAGHCGTCRRLSFSWWTSPFWSCSSILALFTGQVLEDREKGFKRSFFCLFLCRGHAFTSIQYLYR